MITTALSILYKLKHILTMNKNSQEIQVQIQNEFQVMQKVMDYIYTW